MQACPDGHIERVWYNSCRHRFCPQCAQLQIAQWLERQQRAVAGVRPLSRHLHHPERAQCPVAGQRAGAGHRVVSRGVGHAERVAGGPEVLGATPGMIAALHTWGQTLVLHPHLHCLVTGGGWDGEHVAGGAQRLSAAGAGGDAGVSGQTAGGAAHRAGRGAADAAGGGDAGPAADAPAPPGADEVARADHDALCARAGGGDVSGALSARAGRSSPGGS